MTVGSEESNREDQFQSDHFSVYLFVLMETSFFVPFFFYFGNFALQEYPEDEGLQTVHVYRSINVEL